MARLKRRLAGSSMIEAIIASLIFLVLFTLSLSTLTGLSLRRDEGYVLLEAERALADCFLRYSDGSLSPGIYTDKFEWGKIITEIKQYADYEDIQQVAIRATLAGSRKTIEYRRLVALHPANE